MNYLEIRKQLEELAEHDYKKFSAALIPGCSNLLGIRIPQLRKIAKDISKGDWRRYLEEAQYMYFEETMIAGLVVGYAKTDIDERIKWFDWYINKIDNWSLNDTFCSTFKLKPKEREKVWSYLMTKYTIQDEYVQRVVAIMIMDYFLCDEFEDRIFDVLLKLNYDGYYTKMGVAWAMATAYIHYPEKVYDILREHKLDKWTHNKAIQKMKESFRISDEDKDKLLKLKIHL